MIDRAERAETIARAKMLRVAAKQAVAAARNLCHTARNLCNAVVLRQALDDSLRLPGITRPRYFATASDPPRRTITADHPSKPFRASRRTGKKNAR